MWLLWACARTQVEEETQAKVRQLVRQGLRWDFLLEAGRRHGVLPLLLRNLLALCPEAVPGEFLARLGSECRGISLRNLTLTAELLKLLKLFDQNGIETIPHKGPVLGARLYGSVAFRSSIDLDVVVREADVPRANDLVVAAGYQPYKAREHERYFLHSEECHHVFLHPELRYAVEIHWSLTPWFFSIPLRGDRLWQRLQRLPLGGRDVLAHAPEDLLLILCVHGGRHFWMRLGWLADIAELIRQTPALSWEWILKEAGRLHCRRMLLLGLWLGHHVLGAPLPGWVLDACNADTAVAALGGEIQAWLGQGEAPVMGEWTSARSHVRMMDSFRDRLAYLLRWAFSPTESDWVFLALPKALYPLYYPLRILRLIGKYTCRLVKQGR